MDHNVSHNGDLSSPTLALVTTYQPYVVGGVFALTALLSIGYWIFLLHHRSHNHMGGLLSAIFFLTLLFSASRALLLGQPFAPEIGQVLLLLDCLRTASICSLFGITFVAIVRSSESEHVKSYMFTRVACFVYLLLNYTVGVTPRVLLHFYDRTSVITQATQAGCDMYFITILLVMGLAYVFMLPKTLSMACGAKSAHVAPRRLFSAAVLGMISAMLVVAYVMFLMCGFLALHFQFGMMGEGPVKRGPQATGNINVETLLWQMNVIGTSGSEAVLTGLLVICAALLIKTPARPEISYASAPEMQGLLYPGRNTISATYRSPAAVGSNGFHSLYKMDQT